MTEQTNGVENAALASVAALLDRGDREGAAARLVTLARQQPDAPDLVDLALAVGTQLMEPMLQAGLRPVLAAWLTQALRADPTDPSLAHRLALVHYWGAMELEEADRCDDALGEWQQALGCFAMVIEHDGYLPAWVRQRTGVYATDFSSDLVGSARDGVNKQLQRDLAACSARQAVAGQPALADRYSELALRLRVERAAARELKALGGLNPGATSDV